MNCRTRRSKSKKETKQVLLGFGAWWGAMWPTSSGFTATVRPAEGPGQNRDPGPSYLVLAADGAPAIQRGALWGGASREDPLLDIRSSAC